MPVTVPRASVTEASDDLKARDALLRGFPEVESVIGKSGRADTPTDPAPLDMVETFVNFRPKELWPKRVIKYADASAFSDKLLTELVQADFMMPPDTVDDRQSIVNSASQKAMDRFDESMRRWPLLATRNTNRPLAPSLLASPSPKSSTASTPPAASIWPDNWNREQAIDELTKQYTREHARWLATSLQRESVDQLVQQVADEFANRKALKTWYDHYRCHLPAAARQACAR